MGGWYGLLMWYGTGLYGIPRDKCFVFYCGTMFLHLGYPIVLAHVVVV